MSARRIMQHVLELAHIVDALPAVQLVVHHRALHEVRLALVDDRVHTVRHPGLELGIGQPKLRRDTKRCVARSGLRQLRSVGCELGVRRHLLLLAENCGADLIEFISAKERCAEDYVPLGNVARVDAVLAQWRGRSHAATLFVREEQLTHIGRPDGSAAAACDELHEADGDGAEHHDQHAGVEGRRQPASDVSWRRANEP
jgi:hypothetical protein